MAPAQNDFTRGSVSRNILNVALPMTAAQLINILYNLVDRMYIGRLPGEGRLALTGLGLAMPIISILLGFANLCGTGGGALCSIYRGRGELDRARRVLGNCLTLLLIFGVSLTALGLLFRRPLLYLFGASDATIPYADGYLTIYLLGTAFVMVGLGLNPLINAQGFARVGMCTVALGAVVNVVLDPVFIFALDMGVKGAAVATVIAQGCSALWVLRFLTGRRALLRLERKHLPLHGETVKKIVSLGMSGFIVSLTNSLVQVMCNANLRVWGGDLYVGVMTVINSVREVIFMPVIGMTHGSQPVLGYNYGAGAYSRVRQGIRFVSGLTVGFSALAWAATMLVPGLLIRVFNDEAVLLEAGVPAFRAYFALFPFMALQMAGQTVFTALGRSRHAICFSLLRKAVLVAPLTVLLPPLWGLGVYGVFLAEPVSNLIGGLACYITMLLAVYRPLGRLPDTINRKEEVAL